MKSAVTVSVGTFPVGLRHVFRHASAVHQRAENTIVSVEDSDGCRGWDEGCPRPYVTGETRESAAAFVREQGAEVAVADDVHGLWRWIDANESLIYRAPAAFCALELALIDLFGQRDGLPLETLLGLPVPAVPIQMSAVLGCVPWWVTSLLAFRYRVNGFRSAKLKLGPDKQRNRANLRALSSFERVRVDANNLWRDEPSARCALWGITDRVDAVEEPVAPVIWPQRCGSPKRSIAV